MALDERRLQQAEMHRRMQVLVNTVQNLATEWASNALEEERLQELEEGPGRWPLYDRERSHVDLVHIQGDRDDENDSGDSEYQSVSRSPPPMSLSENR